MHDLAALKTIFLILAGYLAASIASGVVVGLTAYWLLSPAERELHGLLGGLLFFCAIASAMIAMYAALPAFAVVIYGEVNSVRQKRYYMIAGTVIGGILPVLIWFFILIPLGLAFGPIAGLIYWFIAGRSAGLAPVSSSSPEFRSS